jgi:hypothetical protein
MAYDPDPVEWLSVYNFIISSILSWISFVLFAHGFKWRSWWNLHTKKPIGIGHPTLYAIIMLFISCASGVAGYLFWREGYRSTLSPPNPESGDQPNETKFLLISLFYILYLGLSILFGPALFICGLQLGYMGITCLLTATISLLSLTIVILGYMIYGVPATLFIIVFFFWLYTVIICIVLYKNVNYCFAPFDALEEQMLRINLNISNNIRNDIKVSQKPQYPIPIAIPGHVNVVAPHNIQMKMYEQQYGNPYYSPNLYQNTFKTM